jgi:thymidylate kinase
MGQLIIFEGPDGVGKSKIISEIEKKLKKYNLKYISLSFPGNENGTLGKLVYDIHHNPKKYDINEQIHPLSKQTLHIAAHIDIIESKIKPLIQDGFIVLLDRFWWSTYVYGIIDGIQQQILNKLIEVEKEIWNDLLPTKAFLITSQKPHKPVENNKFWCKLSTEYKKIAKRENTKYPVQFIDNSDKLCNVVNTIWKFINNSNNKREVKKTQFDKLRFDANSITEINEQLELVLKDENQIHVRYKIPHIWIGWKPAKPTIVFDTYWKFAAERQKIFFAKFNGYSPPWTNDPIFIKHKFTNAYRASDRVSQYLIKNVIYSGDQSIKDVFFRILLFKTFNKIDTWELLSKKLGTISYKDYSFSLYDKILSNSLNRKDTIYSAAYIMTSGKTAFGYNRKHQNHLKLIEKMMNDEIYKKINNAKHMSEVFLQLRDYPTIGDFLAFQYAIDINYSEITNFSEMDFVVAGPGAKDGLLKCFKDFGGLNDVEIIKMMADKQEEEFERLGLNFQDLWGRKLQLIDCQNLFCETDKYARIAHPEINGNSKRTRIKQIYRTNFESIEYWYPPKWNINKNITKGTIK